MPSPERIVINTGPLIALVAGLGSLDLLRLSYREIWVPAEVADEIAMLKSSRFVQPEFELARPWLKIPPALLKIEPWLRATLDLGEAAVIQTAINQTISTVMIDEAVGRRAASLCGLDVTGSIGLLLRAKAEQRLPALKPIFAAMRSNGVWLADQLLAHALHLAGE